MTFIYISEESVFDVLREEEIFIEFMSEFFIGDEAILIRIYHLKELEIANVFVLKCFFDLLKNSLNFMFLQWFYWEQTLSIKCCDVFVQGSALCEVPSWLFIHVIYLFKEILRLQEIFEVLVKNMIVVINVDLLTVDLEIGSWSLFKYFLKKVFCKDFERDFAILSDILYVIFFGEFPDIFQELLDCDLFLL